MVSVNIHDNVPRTAQKVKWQQCNRENGTDQRLHFLPPTQGLIPLCHPSSDDFFFVTVLYHLH